MLLDELLGNFPFVVCTVIIQRHDLGIVLMGIVIGNLFIITYASSFLTIYNPHICSKAFSTYTIMKKKNPSFGLEEDFFFQF